MTFNCNFSAVAPSGLVYHNIISYLDISKTVKKERKVRKTRKAIRFGTLNFKRNIEQLKGVKKKTSAISENVC